MPEDTIESLARRVTSLERQVAQLRGVIPATRDWRSVIGISQRTEFSDLMDAEIKSRRDAERDVALEQDE